MSGKWEQIGPPACPIMYRRTLWAGRAGKLLLHRFMPNADDVAPHDHPRPFLTIVYQGGYVDVQPCPACSGTGWEPGTAATGLASLVAPTSCTRCGGYGELPDYVRAPAVRYRRASHLHTTRVYPCGARSVCIMGPEVRPWGFVHAGRWWHWQEFLARHAGAFRCDDKDA